jgi:type IV pilus assembly protein PilF
LNLRNLMLIMAVFVLQSCHLEHDPLNHNAHDAASYNTQLGLAYLKQGDRARAKRKLLMAQVQAPDSPSVNAAMAYFMEKSGEMHHARMYYLKAITNAPKDGSQLNNYGAFLCRQGHYNEADVYFKKAIEDSQYEHTAGAYENAGLCAKANHHPFQAMGYFIQALEHDPSRQQSLYELVTICVHEGRNKEALAYLQHYPALSSSDPTLLRMTKAISHKLEKK